MSILIAFTYLAVIGFNSDACALVGPSKLVYTASNGSPGATTERQRIAQPTAGMVPYGGNSAGYGSHRVPSSAEAYELLPNRCPLCDGSVYAYCGEKMLHDACCCADPHVHDLPRQCRLADCRFLHANSCREHRLITNCCCIDEYRSLLAKPCQEYRASAAQVSTVTGPTT